MYNGVNNYILTDLPNYFLLSFTTLSIYHYCVSNVEISNDMKTCIDSVNEKGEGLV